MAQNSPSGSQAIERALSVLNCFTSEGELTLSEVAGRTGIPVSTAYRIMQALLRGEFLRREGTERYRIGQRVADLVPRSQVADEVSPHLYSLAARIHIVVSFAAVDGREAAVLVRARPPTRYCAAQVPMDREPLHATAFGKVLLAFDGDGPSASAKRVGRLEAYTACTRTSLDQLLFELREARQRGFAVSDEERTVGVRAVAVPVFGRDRRVLGAIGVQARSQRMTSQLIGSIVPIMQTTAAEIKRRLADDLLLTP
jgi:DNA-binding IclR family transcriptional regulator